MAKKLYESYDYHEVIAQLILANKTNPHAEHRVLQDERGQDLHTVWDGPELRAAVPPDEQPQQPPAQAPEIHVRLTPEELEKIAELIAAKLRKD